MKLLTELRQPSISRTGWPWTTEITPLPLLMPNGLSWPKVSVVTPSYNQGQFIEETIRSVLLQGYPNLEYIIMDGGSTDESVDIIRKYEPWITHWVSEPDGGQARAINNGWRVATGDAVTWLNSDDTLEPESLANAVKTLYKRPDIALVHGKANKIDKESNVIGVIDQSRFEPEEIIIQTVNPFPQPGFLMKRQLLDQFGWLDESMYYCMDFDYWTRLALNDVCAAYVDATLANFRVHASSKTSILYKRQISEHIRIHEKTFASPALKAKYLSQRDRAKSNAELTVAKIAFHKGKDAKLTRQHIMRHIRTAKLRFSPQGLLLLLYSLTGDGGLQFGSRMKQWYKSTLQKPVS